MGKRRRQQQQAMWVCTASLVQPASHPFLHPFEHFAGSRQFDRCVEDCCRKFYAARRGRPSLAPGVYFRLLLIGYFEGIDSECGIAWRAADFGNPLLPRHRLEQVTPDHSTVS
jgi:transposase